MSLPLILTAVSTVVQVVGALKQGKDASRAVQADSKATADAAAFNAQVSEENAQIALDQGRREAEQLDRENRLRLGAIRASAGASGSLNQGSALDVLGDVAAQGELQVQNAIFESELRARGETNTAILERHKGASALSSGNLRASRALASSRVKAGSALFSGAAQGLQQRNALRRE